MNKYENLGVVGEGSYGIVMKCRHKSSGEVVAIKKFLESDDDHLIKKIAMREINMLRKLRHDNLVNLIEVFRRKGHLYLVLEYVNHTVLDELERHPGGLGDETSREYVWQIMRGINFCHSHNIVHRDVKPENVLVSNLGVIKLCDFGFARMLSSSGESCTDYVATRWYRAPELLVGDTRYGKEVDVWASGCLLAEMITGDPIFPGESDIDQLFCIMRSLGNLSAKHETMMSRSPLFNGMKNHFQVTKPLREKYSSWPKLTLDFLLCCLEMDPDNRASMEKLLQHEYFNWDGFADVFIGKLQKKLQFEFSGSLAFVIPNSKNEPRPKVSAKLREDSQQEEDELILNKTSSSPNEPSVLPPCNIPVSRVMPPLRPPTKIAPLTPTKPHVSPSNQEGSPLQQHVIPIFSMPPIGQIGSINPNRDSFEIRRHPSPRLSYHSKSRYIESIQNQPSNWLPFEQKQSQTFLKKNIELLPLSGVRSDSPVGDIGIIHGEKSFLHNRSFATSSKKKTKADTSSSGIFSQLENDNTLPNITPSPGPFSPVKSKFHQRRPIIGIMPSINKLPDPVYNKETLQSPTSPLTSSKQHPQWKTWRT